VSFEELELFATVVAIWIPACAAKPDGTYCQRREQRQTWTNTAGNDAVNALLLNGNKGDLQSMETNRLVYFDRVVQSRVNMSAHADGKCP
jgi:hypothetical protein